MFAPITSTDRADDANRITPIDLFILDQWDAASQKPLEEQRTDLFRAYVALGNSGRWRYHRDLKERSCSSPTASQISEILNRVRNPVQRRIAYNLQGRAAPYLRTFYRETDSVLSRLTDDNIQAITQSKRRILVLDDPNKYAFGDDWRQILDEFPEVVECRLIARSPEAQKEKVDQIKADVLAQEELYYEEEVAIALQWAEVTGTIVVEDEESIPDQDLRYLWLGEHAQIIRETRCNVDLCESLGLLRHRDVEYYAFHSADEGESEGSEGRDSNSESNDNGNE